MESITAELQKELVIEKYRKSRKNSTLSNHSITNKHNHKTACNTALTLTPTSSLGNSQLHFNTSDLLDHSLPHNAKSKHSCVTTKHNKHNNNEVKSSFYKNKHMKTLTRKHSEIITPFEI